MPSHTRDVAEGGAPVAVDREGTAHLSTAGKVLKLLESLAQHEKGLGVPRMTYKYEEKTPTKIFALTIDLSYGSGILGNGNAAGAEAMFSGPRFLSAFATSGAATLLTARRCTRGAAIV